MAPRPDPLDAEVDALRPLVQMFVRRFGLLVTRRTPCGQPLSTTHAHALMVLLERRRAGLVTTQSDLADQLGIDKSNVTRLCQKMEGAGHVSQRVAEADGRSREVSLTAKGVGLAQRIEESSRAHFRAIVARIPSSKRSMVHDSFAVFNEALEPTEGGAR
jgi:DNA-binding MarR family transcriptional regulator